MPQLNVTQLKQVNLAGVAITAEVQPDGTLLPIGGEFEKLLAAARDKALPRIHTVIVADGQREDIERIDPNLLKDDPHADFHVIQATNVDEAVRLLAVDAQTRWGDIIDCTQELRDHRDFVGRDWLRERLNVFINSRSSGYFLITGEPGSGKSAFIVDCLRAEEYPVYHFIKKGRGDWDSPDAFFRSLTAQLRRKYGFPQTEGDKNKSPDEELYAVLQHVNGQLTGGKREIVRVDGLDEAYGPTGRFADLALPGVLRERLPDGVFFVLTSRPGEHLNWLADPALCEVLQLEDEGSANEADVRAYFEERNRVEGLGLSREFIAEALRRSENNFLFAVLLVKDLRALPREQRTPDRIPEGLRGWMVKQLEFVIDKWADLNKDA